MIKKVPLGDRFCIHMRQVTKFQERIFQRDYNCYANMVGGCVEDHRTCVGSCSRVAEPTSVMLEVIGNCA